MSTCGVCLSVCVRLSVTFVSCVKTNKHIINFLPPGSHIILVFHTKRGGDIPTGTSLTGASNAGGVGKNAILDEYLASLHTCVRVQGLQCGTYVNFQGLARVAIQGLTWVNF